MQLAFYFDQTRCTGCGTCLIACKDWHDIPAGPVNWISLSCVEEGTFPEVSVVHMVRPCFHCAEPSCLNACEHNAIFKRESDGIVLVDRELCVACRDCEDACPYGSPQFGEGDNPEMQKCDFCLDRWEEGKKPVCVAACPTRALDAGPIEDLKEKYGNLQEAVGFSYDKNIRPSLVCKPKNIINREVA